jgi:tetratricopeptide (TPR) repeat protein
MISNIILVFSIVSFINVNFASSIQANNNEVFENNVLNAQDKAKLSRLLNQARKYVERGKFQEALIIYRQAALLDNRNGKIFSGIGYLYASIQNYPAAVQAYEKAVILEPNNFDFLYGLGYSLAQVNENNRAIDVYKQALKVNPDNIDALLALGILLLRNEQYSDIEEYFNRIVTLDQKQENAYVMMGTAFYETENNNKTINFLKSSLKEFPGNQDLRLILAMTYFRERDLNKGLEELKIIDSSSPNNARLILKMAVVYEKLEMLPKALSYYQKASALNNNLLEAYGGIARILERQDQEFQAIIAYRRFIELAPTNPYGYHRLGLLLQKRGRNSESKEMLVKAKDIYQQQGKLEKVAEIQKKL